MSQNLSSAAVMIGALRVNLDISNYFSFQLDTLGFFLKKEYIPALFFNEICYICLGSSVGRVFNSD